jgi:hypothetical protein
VIQTPSSTHLCFNPIHIFRLKSVPCLTDSNISVWLGRKSLLPGDPVRRRSRISRQQPNAPGYTLYPHDQTLFRPPCDQHERPTSSHPNPSTHTQPCTGPLRFQRKFLRRSFITEGSERVKRRSLESSNKDLGQTICFCHDDTYASAMERDRMIRGHIQGSARKLNSLESNAARQKARTSWIHQW